MAVTGSIEIPIILDDSNLKSSLNSVSSLIDRSFNEIMDKVNSLNKKSVFTLNTKDLGKSAKDIEAKLEKVNKAIKTINENNSLKVGTDASSNKQLSLLEERLKSLTAQKNIVISVKEANSQSLKTIDKNIKSLTSQKNTILLEGNTATLSKELERIDAQLDDLENVRSIKITLDKQRLSTLNSQLNTVGKVGAVALAGLSTALVGASVGIFKLGVAASDAEEITNKLINTFSNLDDAMTNNAVNDLTTNYGLARVSAEQLLASTGDLLVGFGLAENKALSLSLQAQKLAVDLASYQNKDVASVSHALTAAFVGEREMLKQYGIIVNEELIKQRLLADGKAHLTGMALKQAEAEITLAIAMEQSSKAIGDYERTSQGFANQQRLVGENLKNLSVVMGQNFLPALSELAIYTNKAVEEFTEMLTTNEELKVSLAEAGVKIADFGKALVDWVLESLPKFIESLAWIVDNSSALIAAIVGIAGTFVTLKIALWATNGGVAALIGSFTALNISTGGIILAVGLLVTGLVALGLAYDDTKYSISESTKELIKHNDALIKEHEALEKNVNSYKQIREESTKLVSKYNELSKASVKSAEAQAEQETILKRLKTLYPDLEILYDKQGNAIGYNIEQYNGLTKALNINTKEELDGLVLKTEARIKASNVEKAIIAAEYNKLKDQRDETQKSYNDSLKGSGNTSTAYEFQLKNQNKQLKGMEANYTAVANEGARLNDTLTEQQTLLANINKPISVTPATRTTGTTTSTGGTGDEDYQKTLNDKLKAEKKSYEALKELQNNFHQSEKDAGKTSVEDEARRLEEREGLYSTYLGNVKSLVEQEAVDVSATGGDISSMSITEEVTLSGDTEQALDFYNSILDAQAKLRDDTKETTESFENDWEEGIANLSDIWDEEIEKIKWENLTEGLGQVAGFAKQIFDEIAKYASELGDAIVGYNNQITQNQIDNLESAYDIETDLLDEKYEDEQKALEKQLEALDEMKEAHQEKLDELEEERDDLENEKKEIMNEEDYLALQKKIEDKEEQIGAEKKALDDVENTHASLLDKQISDEEAYNVKKEEMDKQYAIKKAQLERKQAEGNKAMQIFNATMSLASALMGAVVAGMASLLPLIFTPIYTVMAATIGGLQLATIAATPLPSIPAFADGGLVLPSYADNYKKFFGYEPPNNKDNTLAWLRTGERVLTPQETLGYRDFELRQNQQYINSNMNSGNSSVNEVVNNYSVSVNVPNANASAKQIAKAVVKAIGGKA